MILHDMTKKMVYWGPDYHFEKRSYTASKKCGRRSLSCLFSVRFRFVPDFVLIPTQKFAPKILQNMIKPLMSNIHTHTMAANSQQVPPTGLAKDHCQQGVILSLLHFEVDQQWRSRRVPRLKREGRNLVGAQLSLPSDRRSGRLNMKTELRKLKSRSTESSRGRINSIKE
jgi:hypothetical protein